MALANTIAALAAVKSAIKAQIAAKAGIDPGNHFADYADLIKAYWPAAIGVWGDAQMITTASVGNLTRFFYLKQSDANGVEVNWGDGSDAETFDTVGTAFKVEHAYQTSGKYVITVTVLSGTASFEYISGSSLYETMFSEIRVGEKMDIGARAFYGMYSLQKATVTSLNVGEYAFSGCNNAMIGYTPSDFGGGARADVAQYAFAGTLLNYYSCQEKDLPAHVFDGCPLLKYLDFEYRSSYAAVVPSDLETIGQCAFQACTRLSSVNLPDTLTVIDNYAFKDCASLKAIIVRATTPPTLGTDALPTGIEHIYVPAAAVATYQAASGWSAYASIITALS